MAAEQIRVALVGDDTAVEAVATVLRQTNDFDLVSIGVGALGEGSEVVLLVHDDDDEPRDDLAAARERSSAPVVLATPKPSSALVHWAIDAGISDVLALPASPEQAMFVIGKAVRAAQQQELRARGGRVVTVFSPKGGSGKSVVSTNLAVAAAMFGGSRTLLVDLDLQFGDAAIMLGLSPESTVRELIGSPTDLDAEKLEVYAERHHSGVFVLPAPMNPEDAELVGEDAIRSILGLARRAYDVVVVDTAPFFYGPMLATLDNTDELLVICNPDVPTLKNVRLTLKTLELLSFPAERIRIVLNRASGASGMERADVESALERRVDFVLPLDASVPVAVNGATPAVLASSESPFSVAMLELASSASGVNWTSTQRPAARASRLLSFGRS
jgi:pilus assembly protein CpaE